MPGSILAVVDGNMASHGLNSPRFKKNLPSIKTMSSSQSPMSSESSSGWSNSGGSFGSFGGESRSDAESHDLINGNKKLIKISEGGDHVKDLAVRGDNGLLDKKFEQAGKVHSPSTNSPVSRKKSAKPPRLPLESITPSKLTTKNKESPEIGGNNVRKPGAELSPRKKYKSFPNKDASMLKNATEDSPKMESTHPDLGPYLLKQARDVISSGDSPRKALQLALRATKSFERCACKKPNLDLVMSLHIVAEIHCTLGQYDLAIPVLERSIEIPSVEHGHDHALAKFSGYMHLGDIYATMGQIESSIQCYTRALEVQKLALGDKDPRVGDTCRYLAEAHVQALQFDEAERLCQMALDIHREKDHFASLEEMADRRLMGLICDAKGDYESALEHLVMASMAMMSNGQEAEVASVDCSIGETYLALARYDDAVFAYQKALTVFKSTKGEDHPLVASVLVRLGELYLKKGRLRESRSYCENALLIYGKPLPGASPEEVASGLTDISAIFAYMNEHEMALKLLQSALNFYNDLPGQQSKAAGVEAQMGVLYYIVGDYSESYASFQNSVTKLQACGKKKSAFFGIALNQMGLACVQLDEIIEAAKLFEEAKSILEQEYGPYHPDTLGVYSNLAGTYDALGRLDDAIGILEYLVEIREEKLGTANPTVDDEKKRLSVLLKEAGRVRHKKTRSLEILLEGGNSHGIKKKAIPV